MGSLSVFLVNGARVLGVAVVTGGLGLGGAVASAQEVTAYRGIKLASSLASVIDSTGARADSVKSVHARPAHIQELEWRTPYRSSADESDDPVRSTTFTFYNDALYQVVVNYDRTKTNGLTAKDLVDSISAVYGPPMPGSAKGLPVAYPDSVVLATWATHDSSVTLLRGRYATDVQLVVVSTSLNASAQTSIREAVRLDALEAPRRELALRQKEAAEVSAAIEKQRTTNKEGFRP